MKMNSDFISETCFFAADYNAGLSGVHLVEVAQCPSTVPDTIGSGNDAADRNRLFS
jgi:heterodisulfide reductase subunit A-like polyferredoxin